jgi:protein-disulfide isomerase
MAKNTSEARAERTAALMKEQQRQERRRQMGLIGGIMAVLAILAIVGTIVVLKTDEPDKNVKASDYGLKVGSADAPATIVIYEDFLCPACGFVESETSEKLQAAADAGKVQLEYRPFFFLQQFGDYSERAANAFRAVWVEVSPEAAKKFHDALFAEQPSEEGPYPDDDWLVDKAVAAGATEADIRPAIEDMKYQDWVDGATKDAADVRGTPTVFINGTLVEDPTMGAVVDKMLAAAQ